MKVLLNHNVWIIAFSILHTSLCLIPVTKNHDNCDLWAGQGECTANPSYMWSQCHTSCMNLAEDTEQDCAQWASEGECVNNPGYIQVHCPTSCGKAIGWSVWARRTTGINDVLPFSEDFFEQLTNCLLPGDIHGAAEIISKQVKVYLDGGSRMTPLLGSTSPSEYLGMFGIAEAIMYSLSLHKLNAKAIFDKISKGDASDLRADTKKIEDELSQTIDDIKGVIGSGYSADLLMRSLPTWVRDLDQASVKSLALNSRYREVHPVNSELEFASCPTVSGPTFQESIQTIKNIAPQPSAVFDANERIHLNNGLSMPAVGLGTWQLDDGDCERAVMDAIKLGYRHIDTAEAYGNEAWVGWAIYHAINEKIVERKDLFIATKISNEKNAGYNEVKRLVARQLEQLQTDYIDLYMLHSPMRDRNKQKETWKALEELVEEGKIKSLGVSNFEEGPLKNLLSYAKIKPVAVQNKVDLYHIGKQLDNRGDKIYQLTREEGIVMVAYSAFSAYPFSLKATEDPIVKYVAAARGNSPAQVVLRWQLQHGMAVIPRSSNNDRLRENMDALTIPALTSDEMALLDSIQFLTETPVSVAVPF